MPISIRSDRKALLARIAYLEEAVDNYGAHLRALNSAVETLSNEIAVLKGADVGSNTAAALYAKRGRATKTIYQSNFDNEKFEALTPVKFVSSGKSVDKILKDVNYNVFHQMNCGDLDMKPDGVYAEKLSDYQHLLESITSEPNVAFATALELTKLQPSDKQVICHIRHDVDADIAVCIPMAEIEAKLGVRSTYYLLHTAAYYGEWKENRDHCVFERNESMAVIYKKLQDLGHEVALHTDPLMIYQDLNCNGADALLKEIDWLRSIGLRISGTAPHNAPGVYGACNSAIFVDRDVDWDISAGPAGVINGEKWSPLAMLNESELGLEYEANEIFSDHLAIDTDFISMTSRNKWYRNYRPLEMKGHKAEEEADTNSLESNSKYNRVYKSDEDFWIQSSKVPEAVREAGPKVAVLSIHPEYYGWRTSASCTPSLAEIQSDV